MSADAAAQKHLFAEMRAALTSKRQDHRTRAVSIPASVLTPRGPQRAGPVEQRTLGVTDYDTGGALVGSRLLAEDMFPVRRPLAFIERLGVRLIEGLEGADGVGMPVQTGRSTVHWLDSETDTPDETEPATGNVNLVPHDLGGFVDINRRLLLQTAQQAEEQVKAELRASIMEAIERVFIRGTGAGEPLGLDTTPGITVAAAFGTSGSPTRDEVIDTIGECTERHVAVEDIYAIVAPEFATAMAKIEVSAGSGRYLVDGGMLANRVRYTETAHCPANTMFLGDFTDAVVGMWDDIDLMVDPFTNSTSGKVRVTIHHTAGVGFRRRAAFVKGA